MQKSGMGAVSSQLTVILNFAQTQVPLNPPITSGRLISVIKIHFKLSRFLTLAFNGRFEKSPRISNQFELHDRW